MFFFFCLGFLGSCKVLFLLFVLFCLVLLFGFSRGCKVFFVSRFFLCVFVSSSRGLWWFVWIYRAFWGGIFLVVFYGFVGC